MDCFAALANDRGWARPFPERRLGRASQLAEPALRRRFRRRFTVSADNLAERRKKLAREFLRRGIDQPRAELGELAADLRVDLVVQHRDVGPLGLETHEAPPLAKPATPPEPSPEIR